MKYAILIPVLVLAIGGCQIRSANDVRADDARRKVVADSAATIDQAAQAIQEGAPAEAPLIEIRRQAGAITDTQGYRLP